MADVTEPAGWPIRIAVRIDFSDGSEHSYDVRAEDAVAIPLGAAFWPEGVVTPDVAKRMEHDRKQQEEIKSLTADLDCLLSVATLYLNSFSEDEAMALPERMRLQDVEDVVERRGRRY